MKFGIASVILVSNALAVPMEQIKRDISTEIVYTTVWTTTTIYVDASTQAPDASKSSSALLFSNSLAQTSTAAPVAPVASAAAVPVVTSVAAPVAASSPPAAPAKSSVVVAAAAASSASAAPVVSSVVQPAPAVSSTKAAAPVAAAEATVAAVATPPAEVAAAAASSYVGQATYYEVSNGQPGSCGIQKTDNDAVVALALSFMNNGANPNKNPLCGKTINIQGETAVHTAVIYDSCQGCAQTDVDLSPSLFKAAFPHGDGRVNNVKWWIS